MFSRWVHFMFINLKKKHAGNYAKILPISTSWAYPVFSTAEAHLFEITAFPLTLIFNQHCVMHFCNVNMIKEKELISSCKDSWHKNLMWLFLNLQKYNLKYCLCRIFLRQAPLSNQNAKTGDVKLRAMASIFQNSTGGGLNYGVRVGEGVGDTVKNDGAKTHSQQGGHKGALFLQES